MGDESSMQVLHEAAVGRPLGLGRDAERIAVGDHQHEAVGEGNLADADETVGAGTSAHTDVDDVLEPRAVAFAAEPRAGLRQSGC
jgi:hypothetical protein